MWKQRADRTVKDLTDESIQKKMHRRANLSIPVISEDVCETLGVKVTIRAEIKILRLPRGEIDTAITYLIRCRCIRHPDRG